MKAFIRTYLASFAAAYLTSILINGFSYGGELGSSFILFVLALTGVQFFVLPLFKLLSLPSEGLGGLFLRTLLSGLVMYISTSVIDGFSVVSTVLPEISVLDINLPSKDLSPLESLAASAMTYSIISGFLIWLCPRKG